MGGKSLHVRVITPDAVVFDGEGTALRYPGEDGLYGILPNHAAMITTVETGTLIVRSGGGEQKLFVGRGFVEIKDNEVRFAVDSGESAEGIDVERARAAAERARERLRIRTDEVDVERAEYALRRALLRLQTRGTREGD
jgi:F-type H+-transporting ATPase subunit epsilon